MSCHFTHMRGAVHCCQHYQHKKTRSERLDEGLLEIRRKFTRGIGTRNFRVAQTPYCLFNAFMTILRTYIQYISLTPRRFGLLR